MKSVKSIDVRTKLVENGWYLVSHNGTSHKQFKHPEIAGKITVVAKGEIRGKALYGLEKATGLTF